MKAETAQRPAAGPAAPAAPGMRLGVYTDHVFWRDGDELFADRAFSLFVARLEREVDRLVVLARLHPERRRSHYPMPPGVELAPLPWVESLSRPGNLLRMLAGSIRRFWRMLDEVDAVWLVGSYVSALPFAGLALLRRKRVALGIRQDLPSYARSRHPGRRSLHLAADALDAAYKTLGRFVPVIVVGPHLAHGYRRSPRLLELSVSMISESQIVSLDDAVAKRYDGPLQILSVGRLDAEKNPLLLADVLERLRAHDPRWHLVVCGDGPLAGELEARLAERGLTEHADLRGYVTPAGGLLDLYRSSHAFLHVSWTEGLPQILFEAFAAGLPVVATAVGGVAAGAGDAALLVPPGDVEPPVAALERIAGDADLRRQLIERGLARVRGTTIDSEAARVVRFIAGGEG